MTVIKFTGSLNDELDEFFRNFGYTQLIPWRATNYEGITTQNQFDPDFENHFITPSTTVWSRQTRQRETIPSQNERDFDPYYRADLWSVWTETQEKNPTNIKFFLVDNKLLFFWLPRTGRDYKFRAVSRGWGGAEFSKTGGSWFCLHRSVVPDEDGNYPLKFGMPVTYTPIGFIPTSNSAQLSDLTSQSVTFDNPEQYTVSGVAFNWDFQGGLVYRNYGGGIRDALSRENSLERVKNNLAWYGCLEHSYGTRNTFTPARFFYPAVITATTNARNTRQQANRISTINNLLKRIGAWQQNNTPIAGTEFLATCTTEKNLKILIQSVVENQEPVRVAYSIPKHGNYSGANAQTMAWPQRFSDSWVADGWERSLHQRINPNDRNNQRQVQTRGAFTPRAIVTEVKFDADACGPIFSGDSERAWRAKRTPTNFGMAIFNFLINYPVRVPRIIGG